MKLLSKHNAARTVGMSLIEMLTVISIIAILATLLFPVIGRAKTRAKVAQARVEMNDIIAAINGYRTAYTPLPASKAAKSVAANANGDFTYGCGFTTDYTNIVNYPAYAYDAYNNELISILSDLTTFRNGVTTVNATESLNPRHISFLNARLSDNGRPGVNLDGLYRDPWGNPYIISIDLNYDGVVYDAVYRRTSVSQRNGTVGELGLTAITGVDDFGARASVFIWSFGPDGKFDTTNRVNSGVNLDNIVVYK